jgi:hypothetical protein
MGAAFELQKAVYAALTAAVAPTVVYDDTPDNVALPYVQIGEFEEEPWDTDTTIGRETTFLVHTWSRYDGMKSVEVSDGYSQGSTAQSRPCGFGRVLCAVLHRGFEVHGGPGW